MIWPPRPFPAIGEAGLMTIKSKARGEPNTALANLVNLLQQPEEENLALKTVERYCECVTYLFFPANFWRRR
jgi:hypothetical protein